MQIHLTKTIEDQLLIRRCLSIAKNSPDPRTQNGAVITFSNSPSIIDGYNGFFYGINETEDRLNNRDLKYIYITHAERCAIGQAAREGLSTLGATLYASWIICPDCANAAIIAGVKRIVGYKPLLELSPKEWLTPIEHGLTMLREAGVQVELVDGPINADPIRFSGRVFCPRTVALT